MANAKGKLAEVKADNGVYKTDDGSSLIPDNIMDQIKELQEGDEVPAALTEAMNNVKAQADGLIGDTAAKISELRN